jgi:hypothetical protein
MRLNSLLGLFLFFVTLFSPITYIVVSADSSQDISFSADVGSYLNIVMNYNSVYFGTLAQGSNNNSAPDQLSGIYNVTISTNANYRLAVNATDFTGIGSFPVSNLKMDMNATAGNLALSDAMAFSNTTVLIHNNTAYSITREYHGFWLSIPSDAPAGSYSTIASFTYSNV